MSDQIALDFKRAMRRLATTITVVACRDEEGVRHGMTATAVTSLCMDPPALLVCVNRSSAFHARIENATVYSINLLRIGQEGVSHAFSGGLRGEERFSVGKWAANGTGAPYLEEAQATMFCAMREFKRFCTHTIFIGEVEEVRLSQPVAPLLFQDGSYARATALI